MRAAVAFLIEHQQVFFGVLGALGGILAAGMLRLVQQLRTTADGVGTLGLATAWKVGLALAVGAAVGFGLGYQLRPVSATGHLEFPDLVCDHKGEHLVLFLHGWKGDAAETWKRFPYLVCGDRDFAAADVLSLGYPTFIVEGNLTMEGLGNWIAARLAAGGVSRYRRVAIVAHSIGGLVSRRLVLERKRELANVGLIVELSTPHDGTERYTKLLSDVGVKGGRLVGELQKGSPFLEGLKKDWRSLSGGPATYCLGGPQDWVVPYDSAVDGCAEKVAVPVYDHGTIAKPQNVKEDSYRLPMYRVRTYFAEGR